MAKSEISKRLKHSEDIDRITSLPEPLLSHILSLLPTKYAVATSLLSTRWRFLWTSITNLNFDNEDEKTLQRRWPNQSLDMKKMKFAQFVNRVLLLLNPPCIHNFHLNCRYGFCDPSDIDSWICAAMGRTVQKLELHLEMAPYVKLPLSRFQCIALAVLKLNRCIHFNIAEAASISFPNLHTLHLSEIEFTIANNCSVSFPSLKDLLLDSVRYTDEESVHKLFASCSSLENLIIKRNTKDKARNIIISIPSLISLTVCSWGVRFYRGTRLHIDAPALKYLVVEDESLCYFTSENLSFLFEASIKIMFDRRMSAIGAKNFRTNIFKFIGGLYNVKFLSISGQTLEVISTMSANVAPVFCNLTRLELNSSYSGLCWSFVINILLESMDNLEHLVLKGIYSSPSDVWLKEGPLRVPRCLLHRVTTISFTDIFLGVSRELEMVRYFLKNAKVLKKLTFDSNSCWNMKFIQKLLMSHRGSQECQVHFGDDEWNMEGFLLEI